MEVVENEPKQCSTANTGVSHLLRCVRVASLSDSGHAGKIQHARGRATNTLEDTELLRISTSPIVDLKCPEEWGPTTGGATDTSRLAPKSRRRHETVRDGAKEAAQSGGNI